MSLLGSLRNTVIKIINKFNVDGVDYTIQPLLDPVPTAGSPLAVESGGVFSFGQKTDKCTAGDSKNFTSNGAWKYLNWLLKALGAGTWQQGTITDSSGTKTFVAYGNAFWVCGSASKGIWWSSNGRNWVQGTGISTSVTVNCGHYVNGVWIAGTDNNGLFRSTDGKSWAQISSVSSTLSFNSVHYANGLWVACAKGSNGGIYWSEDSINWTRGSDRGAGGYYVTYANNLWVCCAVSTPNIGLLWSEDGKNWTVGLDYPSSFNSVCYANGLWIACSNNLGMFWSEDGKSWTRCTISNSYAAVDIRNACYGNGVWVAGASAMISQESAGIYTSTDGKNWTHATSMSTIAIESVVFVVNAFYAGTNAAGWWHSEDGVIWYQDNAFTTNGTQVVSQRVQGFGFDATSGLLVSCSNNAPYTLIIPFVPPSLPD